MTTEQQEQRLTIRIGNDSLAFAIADEKAMTKMAFESYEHNNSISTAANLRSAFNTSHLLQETHTKALVMVDSPVMLVPTDEFQENDMETLYHHTFSEWPQQSPHILHSIIPSLNVVAVFALQKDVVTVINDHFSDVRFIPVGQPVWEWLRQNGNSVSEGHKLFAYFHDEHMEIICFQQNRFKFYNTYHANHAHDALYFLLYAWKQLGFRAETDELHLVGEIKQRNVLIEKLHLYLQHIVAATTAANFNLPSSAIGEGVTFDLLALYQKHF